MACPAHLIGPCATPHMLGPAGVRPHLAAERVDPEGAYVLIALSEILASITGLEYAFTKAPKNMRSLVMSAFLFMSAIAAALGEAFNALALDPLLVWNYGAMAVIAFVGGALFWVSARKLDRQEDELNNLRTGHVEEK
ncbi:hypothetical protein FIBSPDRAFT_1047851 [Athelia psychrophila]|uniref:Oligopeptide transporter n=1 Tax=Athelia psychrophila TaxID=1759441 RepID=A0A166EMN6_9AGAM|nr:hypothetical protein FIBSPDRAFT_1047851 [Fibularhizoctonia sp. CBS 109695]